MHVATDADIGQIVAASLTAKAVDDGAEVGPLLDQVTGGVATVTADGGYDQDGVYADVAEAVAMLPRTTAVPSETAESAPTQRDHHLQRSAEHGRMGWQKRSGYDARDRAAAGIGRWTQVLGDALRAHKGVCRATEVDVAVYALNRMLEFARLIYVRTI